jgi:hypothetical protein
MDTNKLKEYWKLLDKEDKEICDFIYKDSGLKVRSINDFVNKKNYNYEKAIPSISKCLLKDYQINCIDMLLRALIHKKAKGIANDFIFEFVATKIIRDEDYLLGAAGYVVQFIVVNDDYEKLFKILKNAKKYSNYNDFIKAICKNKTKIERTQKLFMQILKKKGLEKNSVSEKNILKFLSKMK